MTIEYCSDPAAMTPAQMLEYISVLEHENKKLRTLADTHVRTLASQQQNDLFGPYSLTGHANFDFQFLKYINDLY